MEGGPRGGPGGGGAPSAMRIPPNCWVGGCAGRPGTWWKAARGAGGPLAGAMPRGAPMGGRGAPGGAPTTREPPGGGAPGADGAA
jgi:hypothetical protein